MLPTYQGTTSSPGYARGVAYVCPPTQFDEPVYSDLTEEDVKVHLSQFDQALAMADDELEILRDRSAAELGQNESAIFSVQLALLRDNHFVTRIQDQIKTRKMHAQRALTVIVEEMIEHFSAVADEHLREQAQDLRDLGQRLISCMTGRASPHRYHLTTQSVIVAANLSPSFVMELDRSRVVAVVTEWGGPISHAAIILRSRGIPAVTGIAGILDHLETGRQLLINGESATVTVDPTDAESVSFDEGQDRYQQAISVMAEEEVEACITLDGVPIELHGNLSQATEVQEIVQHHLDGVELLRTELLYFESVKPPTMIDQYHTYRQAAEALDGRPLTIRTFDLGGDKIPQFLRLWAEANPHLRLRGLLFSLREHHLLRTQLQAIVQAAQTSDVRVLFPMVMGCDDLCAAIDLLKQIAAENNRKLPPIGAMIETPSSLFALDEILPHVDFLSVGTNDLVQFMLGADRDAAELSEEFVAVYPTVLRAIDLVIRSARQAGKPLCICGEMAGHPHIAPLLVGLGIRKLSLTPSRSVQVRYALRHLDYRKAQRAARQALQCDNRHDVKKLLRKLLDHTQ